MSSHRGPLNPSRQFNHIPVPTNGAYSLILHIPNQSALKRHFANRSNAIPSGGEEVLLDVGGQDATEAFEDVGHSDEAREILDGLKVATLKREVTSTTN